MSDGVLEIKKSPLKEAEQLSQEAINFVDNLATDHLVEYLSHFENDLFEKLLETDWIDKLRNDLPELKKRLHSWMLNWKKAEQRLSRKAGNNKKAQLHILKQELEFSDKTYRQELWKATGKTTAKDMCFYEIELAIRRFKGLK